MRILITGIAGFVGRHLVDFLERESAGHELWGLVRPGWPVPAGLAGRARLLETELEQPEPVKAALDEARPEAIIHLAAQSSPQQSWSDPAGTLRSNVFGLLHMLECVRAEGASAPRILVVGSSEEYGRARPEDVPLTEAARLRPTTPYAVSKIAQGVLALQYSLALDLPIIATRTFHHTGPGRGPAFAEASFARQIAEIENGLRPPVVEVGNLDVERDFADVRDVVRAYWLLLGHGVPGEVYNVCSGVPRRIRALLDILLSFSSSPIEVRIDPSRVRPSDVPVHYGDPGKLMRATGWKAEIPIEETLRDLLDEVRTSVAATRQGSEVTA
jgi:GDP-4-dehydro-6-deoxy-D-mannose reductase